MILIEDRERGKVNMNPYCEKKEIKKKKKKKNLCNAIHDRSCSPKEPNQDQTKTKPNHNKDQTSYLTNIMQWNN